MLISLYAYIYIFMYIFKLTWAIMFHIIPTTSGLYCGGYIPLFGPVCLTCQYLSAERISVAVRRRPTSFTWRETSAFPLLSISSNLPKISACVVIHSNTKMVNLYFFGNQWLIYLSRVLTITWPNIVIASYAAIDSLDDSWLRPLGYARAIPPAQLFPRYQSFIRKIGKNSSRGEGLFTLTFNTEK